MYEVVISLRKFLLMYILNNFILVLYDKSLTFRSWGFFIANKV
jgi:hypothetical protein